MFEGGLLVVLQKNSWHILTWLHGHQQFSFVVTLSQALGSFGWSHL